MVFTALEYAYSATNLHRNSTSGHIPAIRGAQMAAIFGKACDWKWTLTRENARRPRLRGINFHFAKVRVASSNLVALSRKALVTGPFSLRFGFPVSVRAMFGPFLIGLGRASVLNGNPG